MFSGTEMTMPVVPAGYGYNGNNGMFGNDGWWAILLFAMIFGWGGNGFGGWGGNGNGAVQSAATQADIQRGFDNQSVLNKLNGIENGLCDGFYAQNTTMLNGFNGVQRDMCTGFNAVTSAIAQLGFQNQQCCCDTQKEIIQSRFDASRNTCDIVNAIREDGNATRALINANTMQDLRDRLAERDRDLQSANFQISQIAQTSNIVNQIKPCPIPAYLSCSPYQSFGPYGYGNGYGNGCGCNSGCC